MTSTGCTSSTSKVAATVRRLPLSTIPNSANTRLLWELAGELQEHHYARVTAPAESSEQPANPNRAEV